MAARNTERENDLHAAEHSKKVDPTIKNLTRVQTGGAPADASMERLDGEHRAIPAKGPSERSLVSLMLQRQADRTDYAWMELMVLIRADCPPERWACPEEMRNCQTCPRQIEGDRPPRSPFCRRCSNGTPPPTSPRSCSASPSQTETERAHLVRRTRDPTPEPSPESSAHRQETLECSGIPVDSR